MSTILPTRGYRPEFGARELKRQIRQELETRLAKEILSNDLKSGDSVEVSYDKDSGEVKFNRGERRRPRRSVAIAGPGRSRPTECGNTESTEGTGS